MINRQKIITISLTLMLGFAAALVAPIWSAKAFSCPLAVPGSCSSFVAACGALLEVDCIDGKCNYGCQTVGWCASQTNCTGGPDEGG